MSSLTGIVIAGLEVDDFTIRYDRLPVQSYGSKSANAILRFVANKIVR